MSELILINDDGLTGRLVNPYHTLQHPQMGHKVVKGYTWYEFEETVKSYLVITDAPLVPGSVHKASLMWQYRLSFGSMPFKTVPERSMGNYKDFADFETFCKIDDTVRETRQAYQLIEEPKYTNEEYLDLHGHDDEKYPKDKISTKEYFALPEDKRRKYSRFSAGNEVSYLLTPHLKVDQPTQEKPQFKTAEEILDKYGIFDYNYASKSLVINVMEEYANQFKK